MELNYQDSKARRSRELHDFVTKVLTCGSVSTDIAERFAHLDISPDEAEQYEYFKLLTTQEKYNYVKAYYARLNVISYAEVQLYAGFMWVPVSRRQDVVIDGTPFSFHIQEWEARLTPCQERIRTKHNCIND